MQKKVNTLPLPRVLALRSAVFFAVILVLISSIAYAAPLPWGIAISKDNKSCGGFWAGDEYGSYTLAEGWTAYYPNDGAPLIKTDAGTCEFTGVGDEEKCCRELDLPYVARNVGTSQGINLFWWIIIGYSALFIVGIVIAGTFLILHFAKKKKK
ncbi:MAG: hypothetical protein V1743_02620 [Nanoarchaeota archaeon]